MRAPLALRSSCLCAVAACPFYLMGSLQVSTALTLPFTACGAFGRHVCCSASDTSLLICRYVVHPRAYMVRVACAGLKV